MLDVSALVHQMHDTLSQIHETITSLDTKKHDEKLDALEAQRDSVFEQLQAAFKKQREELEQKRKSVRDEIAEKRRKEDEEIAARRKQEDDELQTRDQSEDSEHEKKLEEDKKGVELETDNKMEEIETEAQRLLDEGHKKISDLEQKRREINSLIDEQMKAPLPPPPKRRRGTRSTPAQSAPPQPAQQEQQEQQEASREIAPSQEPAPVVESKEEPRETAPETTSSEETVSKEAVPEQAPQAEIVPEETSAKDTTAQEIQADQAKSESESPEQSSAQEDQHQDKTESSGPQDVSEDQTATNGQHEHQEEPAREIQETADASEPKEDVIEDQRGKSESNTADQQPGDEASVHDTHEEETNVESPEHQEETAREIQSEPNDIAESKPEHPEDSAAQVDSHTSDDHQAEKEEPAHVQDKSADEQSVQQQDSTRQVLSEPTDSEKEPEAEHSASEPQRDLSHTEDSNASKPPSSAEEVSSAPEPTAAPAQEEQATAHQNDPTLDGIPKGGAAEEYLEMANAEPDAHHEDSAPTSDAVESSESAPLSSAHEQATSQKDNTDSASPTETRDLANAEVVEKGIADSAPAHDEKQDGDEPSLFKQEETPSAVTEEKASADSQPESIESHDADDREVQDVSHDEQPHEAISQEQHDEPTSNDQHSTEQPVEPQEEQQQEHTSPDDDDHHVQNEEEPSLGSSSELKDQDTQGSRDVEVDDDHPSDNQAAVSEPKAREVSDSQLLTPQAEDTEQVHEGSGNDLAPSRGLDVNDSGDHPAEGNSDLSGSEPIPETMTHGKDGQDAEETLDDAKTAPAKVEEKTTDRELNTKAVAEKSIDTPANHAALEEPQDAENKLDDASSAPAEVDATTIDRELNTEAVAEQSTDAPVNHAALEEPATDSQASTSQQDAHDATVDEHGAMEHAAEHHPDAEVQNTEATREVVDEAESGEQPVSALPSSHEGDSAHAEEGQQQSFDKSHADFSETPAHDTQTSTSDHPADTEQASQDIETEQHPQAEVPEEHTEEHTVAAEDPENPSGHEAPAISVSEHGPSEGGVHVQDSKLTEGPNGPSSRDLSEPGPENTTAQNSAEPWEDRHSSSTAAELAGRRPSTIHTDILNPDDDDADVGLFAVPPTPRDEISQHKPTSLQSASPSPPPPSSQAEVGGHNAHEASASLPNTAQEDSYDAAHGTDSAANGHETGPEHETEEGEEEEEEDRTSQPPWLAQNGQPEALPQLQTGTGKRDIYANDPSPAHSRDGSYHEDFKLSPVAYTPVDKKSRSVEAFEQHETDQNRPTDDHDKHTSGDAKAEMSPTAPIEEHEISDGHPSPPEEELSKSTPQEQHFSSTEPPHDQGLDAHARDDTDSDEFVTPSQQPTSYVPEVNYDGEGYGPSPTEEHHYDIGATAFPQSDQMAYSSGLPAENQSEARSSFSGQDGAVFSHGDDRTETQSHMADTPTMATSFDKDQTTHDRAETSGKFHDALGNLPDESAHTVQGTDDLFDDDDDDDDDDDSNGSDYGEALVETTEKHVYQANGSQENVALGGNHSSLSLGRNSMASQGSYGHRSAGSRSSFGSVRETTPLRVADGLYLATSPSIVRADWAADHEEELRTSARATPLLQPSTSNDTPGISPFALRNTPAGGAFGGGGGDDDDDSRGLSASRWSPRGARPQTPQAAAAERRSPQTPASAARLSTNNNPFRAQETPERPDAEEVDPSMYMPRDVTNTPWHARNDSIPMSLHSQTTLSSNHDSPIHSSLAVDRHEPVIRDSWPAPAPGYQQYLSSWGGRPRGDSSLSSNNGDYDPFKADANGSGNVNKSSIYNPFQQRGRAESAVSAAPSAASAASASPGRGSGLFQKMRSVFEQGGSAAGESPALTRPVSGTYHAISPMRSPARPEHAEAQEGQGQGQGYSNQPAY